MTDLHDLVVLTRQTPSNTDEALPGPLTALRQAVRDLGGHWTTAPDLATVGSTSKAGSIRPTSPAADWQASHAIWPTYHDAIQPPVFRPDWQRTHRDRNSRCAQAADRLAAPGATVWIIGHELQLAPAMLRTRRPDIRIGFYLPIPFPPVELFRRLPCRDDLLRGLLGADVVALQTRRDVDNLLRAAEQLLGVPVDGSVIDQPDRPTRVQAIPTSVGIDDIARRAADPAGVAQARALRTQLGDPRLLILGVDPLDHTAGIEYRLHAVEQLLTERQLRNGHTTVVQIAVPPAHRAHADEDLRHRVEQLVARINGDHGRVGRPAVHYLHRALPGADLLALYQACDILLATPLRDGMNLAAKQYVASKVDNSGAVILSEFSGAATELRTAHLVNPYDLEALKATIRTAATESPRQATCRMQAMRRHIRHHDARSWARKLLSTLAQPDIPTGSATSSVIPAGPATLRLTGSR